MNRRAQWLAWLVHDRQVADGTVPGRHRILWNTRSVDGYRQVDHYWSEVAPGATPGVEVWLGRHDVTRWVGEPYTLWRVEGNISLRLDGIPGYTFRWELATLDQAKAREEFNRLRGFTRRQLLPSLVRRLP